MYERSATRIVLSEGVGVPMEELEISSFTLETSGSARRAREGSPLRRSAVYLGEMLSLSQAFDSNGVKYCWGIFLWLHCGFQDSDSHWKVGYSSVMTLYRAREILGRGEIDPGCS